MNPQEMAGSGKPQRMWPLKAGGKDSRVTATGNYNSKKGDTIPKHPQNLDKFKGRKSIFKALLGEFQSDKIIIGEGTGTILS